MRPAPPFAGKTVLVTGTARGIGRACAVRFVERGATVVGGDRLISRRPPQPVRISWGRSSR